MINGDRVKQARELRGLTQSELAERVKVNQSAIAQIESGRILPKEDVLERIVIQTGFPKSFFKQQTFTEFQLGSLLFRARASVNLREKYEASQYARTIFEVFQKLESHFEPIPLRLPHLSDEPHTPAKVTRSYLGLSPDTPINNLTNFLEKIGVLILAVPKKLQKRDAFSIWAGHENPRPIIAISSGNPGDRLRFSVSHELGHLVMHENCLRGSTKNFETEANQFTQEFLLPEKAINHEIIPPVTLLSLAPLKLRWGVSIQALIMRAHDLEIISERQKKYLFQQMGEKGWRKREPENLDIPAEKPQALRKLAELVYGLPIDFRKFATEMNLSIQFLKEIINACATTKPSDQTNKSNKPVDMGGKTRATNLLKPNFSKN